MTSKFLNFSACVLLVQSVSSCAAPLSEQCRQLKVAANMTTESYYAYERETNREKKSELLSQSFREKAKILKNLSLSDSYLKGIQGKLIQNIEGMADVNDIRVGLGDVNQFNKNLSEISRLGNDASTIQDDLKNYCQN